MAYRKENVSLKKLDLSSLKGRKEFEILAVRGKIKGYEKDLTLFSCYLPPKLTRQESAEFFDVLTDAITQARSSSDGWISIGGDWNNRSLQPIQDLFPDILAVKTGPTRKNSTLDIFCNNFNNYVRKTEVCSPLEGELGQVSDHGIVLFEALLPRKAAFSWETHEYLKITEEGKNKFITDLNATDWSELKGLWPDEEKMTAVFQIHLDKLMNECFAWKRVRKKSNNKPWMTDSILERIDDRKKVFRKEGRSDLFNRLNKGIQKTIRIRKKKHEQDMLDKLEQTGRTNQ